MDIFAVIFWLGIIAQIIIRFPYQKAWKTGIMVEKRALTLERALFTLLWIGTFLAPLVYSATNWLDFADYDRPAWLGWVGAGLLALSLVIFARSHIDLKANWSPTLEIRSDHSLITEGIYKYIRHPMYASQLPFVFAQALLLHNWIAGLAGLALFIPFYLIRVPAEERMMLDRFGDEYRQYMSKTGRVLPRL